MQRLLFILLTTTIIWSIALTGANAQRVSHYTTTDTSYMQPNDYDRLFSYFINDKEKIKTLFKFNAVDWGTLRPSLYVETALTPSFTIEPMLQLAGTNWSFENGLKYALKTGFDFKYYFNLKKRQRAGKSINGFSGNYYSLGVYGIFSDYPEYLESLFTQQRIKDVSSLQEQFYSGVNANVCYGIQRRVGNIGFIDVKLGVGYSNYRSYPPSLFPYLSIGMGFGATLKTINDLIE